MTEITLALGAALLHFVWQGVIVAVILWVALFLLRKKSASLRYAAGCAALAVLALLPVVTTCALYSGPAVAQTGAAILASAYTATLPRSGGIWMDWFAVAQAWAVPMWSCGVLLFSLRMAWGCMRIAAIRRSGNAPEPGIRDRIVGLAARLGIVRPVRVALLAVTGSPSVAGWLRPVILLPVSAVTGLTPDQLDAVLAHELAHIRRHDYLVNLVQMAAEALLFYHPAVWWVSGRIRLERELCCDDLAVRACGGALTYARALTALEKMRSNRAAMALGSADGPLFHRIRRLVEGGGEYGPTKLSGAVALALALTCVAACVTWVRAQELGRSGAPETELVLAAQVNLEFQQQSVRKTAFFIQDQLSEQRARLAELENRPQANREQIASARRKSADLEHEAALSETAKELRLRFQDSLEQIKKYMDTEQGLELEKEMMAPEAAQRADLAIIRAQIATRQRTLFAVVQQRLQSLIGRQLISIDVRGLSGDAKRALLSRLPLHNGDALSLDNIEATTRSLRKFDERLEFVYSIVPEGATLTIHPPE